MWYNIQDFETLIFDMIFDSSTSVNFVAIKSLNKCGPLLCNLYVLNGRYEPPYVILVPTSHGQVHRLIPHVDVVELAFVFIYIYQQQMLWCV